MGQFPARVIIPNRTRPPSGHNSNHPYQTDTLGDVEQERQDFLHSLQRWASGKFTPDGESYEGIVTRIYQAYINQWPDLDLSHLSLTSLPSVLTQLTHLKTLKINNNYLYELPENFNHLTQLESLDLANNGFDSKPEILKVLKKMKLKLDIINPWFLENDSASKEFKDLKQCLNRWTNDDQDPHQKSSREHASQIILSAYTQQATDIILNNLLLTNLPERVFSKLTSLKSIQLINNQLQRLPEDFYQLPLESLSLGSNQFSQFPKPLELISTLKFLTLDYNQLTELNQQAVSNLKQLKYLNMGHNQLRKFLICNHYVDNHSKVLQNLQVLNLDANRLSQFPKAILSLTALKELSVESNQLQVLPEALRDLPALKLLQIRENPASIGLLKAMAYQLVRDIAQGHRSRHRRDTLSSDMSAFSQEDNVELDAQSVPRLWNNSPRVALARAAYEWNIKRAAQG
jgi:Leucine-rich repeat (LRR) protein